MPKYNLLKDQMSRLVDRMNKVKRLPKPGYLWINRQRKQVKKASQEELDNNTVYEMAIEDYR